MKHIGIISICIAVVLVATSCRHDIELQLGEETQLDDYTGAQSEYKGFYLLNEGNMGMNKSTLDFFDFEKGTYKRNIYAEMNPNVPKELGDVGNEIQIYAGRLYAIINASNKVEVMDAVTAKRIGQIEIPNCRHIRFAGNYAYVTSFAGPIEINPDYKQKGYVAKIDLISLREVARCIVGYQPEELEIVKDNIYVANSGGYMGVGNSDNYEKTLSVIDLESFKETKKIVVDINLHRVRADKRGNLWISSRADYLSRPARLYCYNIEKQAVTDTIAMGADNLWIAGDSIYAYSTAFNFATFENNISYAIFNTATKKIVTNNFITDGSDKEIELPYGIMINPANRDIYITDAGDYISPGMLYCYDKGGKKKWSVMTGDIPAHFALLKKTP